MIVSNTLLYTPVQHGSCCNHSCNTQLAGLLYDLTINYNHDTKSDLMLTLYRTDFSGYCKSLGSSYGLSGYTLQLIESFLTITAISGCCRQYLL